LSAFPGSTEAGRRQVRSTKEPVFKRAVSEVNASQQWGVSVTEEFLHGTGSRKGKQPREGSGFQVRRDGTVNTGKKKRGDLVILQKGLLVIRRCIWKGEGLGEKRIGYRGSDSLG